MTKLEQIGIDAGERLKALWNESLEEIERGIVAATEESQNQDKEAKFRVGFSITLNLDRNVLLYSLKFSTQHKLDSSSAMPDDNQETLPFIATEEDK